MSLPTRPSPALACSIALLVLTTTCTSATEESLPPTSSQPTPVDPLRDRAVAEGRVGVIVDLVVPRRGDGSWEREDIAEVQRDLLAELPRGVRVVARYETTPQIALQVTPRALARLRASRLVLVIHLN
jgi:hypothetical protein